MPIKKKDRHKPLADQDCKNAPKAAKAYKLGDYQGLYLHIMPNGGKYWRYRYRFLKKQRLLAIGVYPEVTLAEAREKRNTARKLLAAGIDPSLSKLQHRQLAAISAGNTFESLAREWHETKKAKWSECRKLVKCVTQ